jgi:hypothetical protein
VVATLFAAPAFAWQSMNMTGMENIVGVLSSVTHPLLVRVGSDPQRFGGNPGHCSAIPRRQTAAPAAGAAIKVFLKKCKSAMS